jgi:hypothetical protein
MTTAENVVGALLETHEKWDRAHKTWRDLYGKHQKAHELLRELGRTIGYERALAQVGLTRADVSHPIRGDQVGATHNYKGTHVVKQCRNRFCGPQYAVGSFNYRSFPPGTTECPECKEPLVDTEMRISPTLLRTKLANAIVGVETNDGRYVWFKRPLPADPSLDD